MFLAFFFLQRVLGFLNGDPYVTTGHSACVGSLFHFFLFLFSFSKSYM